MSDKCVQKQQVSGLIFISSHMIINIWLDLFRLNELVGKGDGIAILESEMALGSGGLMGFGINSNTSANGFIKCLYKRKEIIQGARPNPNGSPNQNKAKAPVPAAETMSPEGSPVRKKLKEKNCGLEEDDSDDNDMVDESEVY